MGGIGRRKDDLRDGLAGRFPEGIPEQLFLLNQMEASAALLLILLPHKNEDRSTMARGGCWIPLVSMLAVLVNGVHHARSAFPPANHDASAPSFGRSLPQRVRFLWLPCSGHQNRSPCTLLSWGRAQSSGTMGLAATVAGSGCTSSAPNP